MFKKHIIRVTFLIFSLSLGVLLFSSFAFASEPKYGGTLRIGVYMPQFDSMDARYSKPESLIPSSMVLYDRLLDSGEEGLRSLVPSLATSIETKDNINWIIRLRKGVKFHNGREMTAEDVKANFDWAIKTPKGMKPVRGKRNFTMLEKTEVIDRYTVRLITDRPYSPLPWMIQKWRGIIPPEEVEKWGDDFTFHPTGTGPYKFVESKPKEKVVLDRFEGYWGSRPYVDKLEYKFYRSDEGRLIALQKGELDIALLFDEAKPILDKDPNITYEEIINTDVNHRIFFNFRRWPMNDHRFRKAVSMGADWKNIAINAFAFRSGNYSPTLLGSTKYFNPEALKLIPPFNPEEAKKLIKAVEKDAGKKIPPIYWLDSTWSFSKAIAEVAQIQLAEIGVPLNLQLLSMAIWANKLLYDPKLEWDIGLIGVGFGQHPSNGFKMYEAKSGADGKSLGGYSNPEMDRWLRKAEAALNEQEMIKAYQEAEKVVLKDIATVPLIFNRLLIAYNKKIKGMRFNDTGNIYITTPWVNIWIDE